MNNHTEKHPNELLMLDVDAKKPSLHLDSPLSNSTTYKKMKCYDRMTKEFVGYLGSYGNNLDVVTDEESAELVSWVASGNDKYLSKDSSPIRYLGLGWNSYACWGMSGGWNDAIIYDKDSKTISLKSDPKRKLYLYGNNWICWSNDDSNANILTFELE